MSGCFNEGKEEGFISSFMVSDMVEEHKDSEKKPAAATLWATLSD